LVIAQAAHSETHEKETIIFSGVIAKGDNCQILNC